jgi:hypothetical protein
MKHLVIILSLLLSSASLQAEEKVNATTLFEEPLTITAVPAKQRHEIVVFPEPGISSPVYALKGRVRYENVDGDGFLQMDSHFGEMGTFFSKSLAPSGPLGKISGSSDWRPFVLPFYASNGDQPGGAAPIPQELTLSLYLPGPGTVSISDVGLYQYAHGEDPLQQTGQWFGNRSAALVGAASGGLIGLWGALIGVLSARGKARGFVLSSANALLIIGIASLVAGVIAFASAQPYAVYYPFKKTPHMAGFLEGSGITYSPK